MTTHTRSRKTVRHDLDLQSPVFPDGGSIPVRHTADGQNVSPPLSWNHVPRGVKTLALILEDLDATVPTTFTHWMVANLDPAQSGCTLNEGTHVLPGAVLGKNGFGDPGYGGPEPPRGDATHHYRFRLLGLDTALSLPEGFSREALLRAVRGHVIAAGELIGTYRR